MKNGKKEFTRDIMIKSLLNQVRDSSYFFTSMYHGTLNGMNDEDLLK